MISDALKSSLDSKLWATAIALKKFYKKRQYRVSELTAIDTVNTYRVDLVCKKQYETIAIIVRERGIETFHQTFIEGCHARRLPVKIYVGLPEIIDGEETLISASMLNRFREMGAGLLVVGTNGVRTEIDTVGCSRRFALEPGTSLEKHKVKVDQLIKEYNEGKCLSAVRDLAEEAEDATILLARKAASKGKINLSVEDIDNATANWEDVINVLSASNYRGANQTKIFPDNKFKNSIVTFKDKRNLSDHRKTKKQLRDLEDQYPEAMLQGIRLIRKLTQFRQRLK